MLVENFSLSQFYSSNANFIWLRILSLPYSLVFYFDLIYFFIHGPLLSRDLLTRRRKVNDEPSKHPPFKTIAKCPCLAMLKCLLQYFVLDLTKFTLFFHQAHCPFNPSLLILPAMSNSRHYVSSLLAILFLGNSALSLTNRSPSA